MMASLASGRGVASSVMEDLTCGLLELLVASLSREVK
jgi:hypothetical protein